MSAVPWCCQIDGSNFIVACGYAFTSIHYLCAHCPTSSSPTILSTPIYLKWTVERSLSTQRTISTSTYPTPAPLATSHGFLVSQHGSWHWSQRCISVPHPVHYPVCCYALRICNKAFHIRFSLHHHSFPYNDPFGIPGYGARFRSGGFFEHPAISCVLYSWRQVLFFFFFFSEHWSTDLGFFQQPKGILPSSWAHIGSSSCGRTKITPRTIHGLNHTFHRTHPCSNDSYSPSPFSAPVAGLWQSFTIYWLELMRLS